MMRNFTGSPWSALACIALLGSVAFAPTGRAAVHSLPLVLPAGNPALTGVVRIVNRSDRAGDVDITAIDDSGNEAGPITLSIGADSSRHFNSEDLEEGNADKEGLSDGVGGGQCSWRLELETDLDILPLAFVRTGDGFVTSIHDVVPEVEPGHHDVAIFNPGKNMMQQSRLRLVNLGDTVAQAEIAATDDKGNRPEDTVRVTVPAGGACMVTAHELESGESSDPCHCEVSGELGEGSGKWQLSVTTDQSIQVMSVLKTPEHLTNLSTVRYAGFAPPDGAAFNARFVGRRVRATDGSGYVDFVSSGRFSESDDDGMYEGDSTYKNEGPNSGTLVFDYEDGEKCTALAAFDSFIAGTTLSVCEDRGVTERQPIRSWVLEDIGPAGMALADQAAFDALVDSRRLAHDDPSWLGGVAVVFVSPGGFSQGTGGSERTGTYAYENTGWSLGTVELTYAGGGTCTLGLVFEADDSGRMEYTCDDASNNTTTGSTNWRLEFAGATGLAPANQNAFYERFRDKRLVAQGSSYYVDFLPRTRFRENDFGDTYEGTYTYVSTGANTAELVLEYDDDDRCDVDLAFESLTSGHSEWDCRSEGQSTTGWQAIDRP